MAAKDIVTKNYMNDVEIFADAFNYFLFDGECIIDPSKLHTIDSTEIGMPYGEGRSELPIQKFRDGFKYLAGMEDEMAAYLLLGIEDQSEIHYAMPVKNMVYDALQYATQVEKAAKSHRKAAKEAVLKEKIKDDIESSIKRPSSGEYLSGFYREDRLVPVITLVILFSPESWDGPTCIHNMLAVKNKNILEFVPDYKINLIAPAQIDEIAMNKFKTNLREVLLYIKYSKDKEKLKKLLKDERFKRVERKAAMVINTVTHSNIKIDEKEEVIDMCKAIEELQEEVRREGKQEGRQQILLKLIRMGEPDEKVKMIGKLSDEQLEELKKQAGILKKK